jgi:hypothetical protein
VIHADPLEGPEALAAEVKAWTEEQQEQQEAGS